MAKKHKPARSSASRKTSRPKPKSRLIPKNWIWIAIAALVVVLIGGIYLFVQQSNQPKAISVAEARQKYDQGVTFIDVRTQEEWDTVHVLNAKWIPLNELPDRLNELPKDQEVVVYCNSQNRSKVGAQLLKDEGFKNVTYMNGGIQAWVSAGYPQE